MGSRAENNGNISPHRVKELLEILRTRFDQNMGRHSNIRWDNVLTRLEGNFEKLRALNEMEMTEGEPDVVAFNGMMNVYVFCDCSAESPKGRRNVCYDGEALESRKEFKPGNSAVDLASAMGIELLTEEQYRELQKFGEFDAKTSSWLKTPDDIRNSGGAIFGDRRFGHVFIYHNGASSYYAARGFRGLLRV